MISAAFIISSLKKNAAFVLILLISAYLRFSKLSQIFSFDYDQQIPAESAYDFFVNHKLTLIGQELSFEGFFLGPIHNWITFIPYGMCKLRPDCVPYFYSMIGLMSVVILYVIVKKIFDQKTALIASAIYGFSFSAISFEIGVNSNYFLFSTSLALLYCIYKYFENKDNYLLLGGFLAGLATVNFNPVFIFTSIVFFVSAFFKKNLKKSIFLTSLALFFINFIPLIVFNLRHNGILFQSAQKFLQLQTASTELGERFSYILFHISLPFFTNYLFQSANSLFILLLVFLLIAGFFICKSKHVKISYYLGLSIVFPIIGFVFYRGHIPEYYFQQSALPIILFMSFTLGKNILIFVPVITLLFYQNVLLMFHNHGNISYETKKQIVNYVIDDSNSRSFNVYYDMPPGVNTGYSYLFKASKKIPVDGGENLYIIKFSDPAKFAIENYYKTYSNKQIRVEVFGFIHVVSVK